MAIVESRPSWLAAVGLALYDNNEGATARTVVSQARHLAAEQICDKSWEIETQQVSDMYLQIVIAEANAWKKFFPAQFPEKQQQQLEPQAARQGAENDDAWEDLLTWPEDDPAAQDEWLQKFKEKHPDMDEL
ncbi:hypothetical protein B0H63DRAFT_524876 [Podospora didyma]|uniref:Uncharacterized protein n=1 Tax=Podospora didyma TaxID=330526 RepID=A0AAE0KJ08_9PEZI|nr:hypothetical protein B0H63DRAFT_524876 [Podospora didyma]